MSARARSAREVLGAFAWLGCSSFGGPVAHLGYFRREFVERRAWLDESAYADLVALSQFLPGPASSKLGFSLGVLRAGYLGGLAAWAGFTLPSALLLVLFAYAQPSIATSTVGSGLLHGLKLVAVAVVAQAVWVMARALCPDLARRAIAVAAAAAVLALPVGVGQASAIAGGLLLGLLVCRGPRTRAPAPLQFPVSGRVGLLAGGAFLALLALAFAVRGSTPVGMFTAFFRSGALVFGGGHVVLPLLSRAVVEPGWTSESAFLAGYGAAQAVPGPLFTFAAYLGTIVSRPLGGLPGAALALVGIFLPGLLLQLAALPFWSRLRGAVAMQGALRGVNAAVVGLLAAALYQPVWTSAVADAADVVIVFVSLSLLLRWKLPPLLVVALCAAAGIIRALV